MTTDNPQHLWLLVSQKIPYIKPLPSRPQQTTVPHQNNYSLEIQADYEQEESGLTQTHTFHFGWPGYSDLIFFYAINMGEAHIKATRSPIFVYALNKGQVFYEDWSSGLDGQHPWVTFTTDPLCVFAPSLNSLVMEDPTNNGMGLRLDVNGLPGIGDTPACDLIVSLGASRLLGPINSYGFTSIGLAGNNPGEGGNLDLMHWWNPINPCSYSTTHMTNAESFAGGINWTSGLGAAAYFPKWLCPTTPTTGDPLLVVYINLTITTAGPPAGPAPNRARFGPITIWNIAGPLRDVSFEWRKLRIHPFIP